MNLAPTNASQKPFGGVARRLGYPGTFPSRVIHVDEVEVHYSEDEVGCIYVYRGPAVGRGA
eukprot:1807492-Lingulodinium_polyedra.AAC.1